MPMSLMGEMGTPGTWGYKEVYNFGEPRMCLDNGEDV